MVNGTLLNFCKRYEVIFYQWPKSHLGLDALSNQKILKGIYCIQPGPSMTSLVCSDPSKMVCSDPPRMVCSDP